MSGDGYSVARRTAAARDAYERGQRERINRERVGAACARAGYPIAEGVDLTVALSLIAAALESLERQARLGNATTGELLVEIEARGRVEATSGGYVEQGQGMAIGARRLLDELPGRMLEYRTADSS